MTQNQYERLLFDQLEHLFQAAVWLQKTHAKISQEDLSLLAQNNEKVLDLAELLTARFARLSDMLFQKLYRTLDKLELEVQEGTMIDLLNRAHKKGLIESVEQVREIRELRNMIAHEYATEQLGRLAKESLKLTPVLLQLVETLEHYCQRFKKP